MRASRSRRSPSASAVPEQRVRQRLRLGKVAPELLDEFRAGALSLELMMAFALGADHATQLAGWRQVKDQSYVSPHAVRRLLTQSAVPLDSPLGSFVGAAAYEAAAGTVTRDLFSTGDEGFMDDAALVRRCSVAPWMGLPQLRCWQLADNGSIRARNSSVLALPYIDRFRVFNRLIWPSVGPLFQLWVKAFFTASKS